MLIHQTSREVPKNYPCFAQWICSFIGSFFLSPKGRYASVHIQGSSYHFLVLVIPLKVDVFSKTILSPGVYLLTLLNYPHVRSMRLTFFLLTFLSTCRQLISSNQHPSFLLNWFKIFSTKLFWPKKNILNNYNMVG